MSYVTKRKLLLRPVLDKKKGIEETTNLVKARQEAETAKLDKIKTEFDSVSLELEKVNVELKEIEHGSEEIGNKVLDYLETARQGIFQTDQLLDFYAQAIALLDKQIKDQQENLDKTKALQKTVFAELAAEDGRLERKRTDIKIYEDRLRKRLKDSGMEDVIKLVFE